MIWYSLRLMFHSLYNSLFTAQYLALDCCFAPVLELWREVQMQNPENAHKEWGKPVVREQIAQISEPS